MTNQWVPAERFGQIEVREYVHGDQARHTISISANLKLPTLVGGFVARNPNNHEDQWYIAREYFNKYYRIPAEPGGELVTKLHELAESQTDLDPEARHVLYSRMRELYLK